MFAKAISVSQITEYIKRLFSSDVILNDISVCGEISNFKHHYSGHMYFTLKDSTARIKCVMFKNSCQGLNFYPEDGMNVIVSGRIGVYDRDGQYQIYAETMQQAGIGGLYAAFEKLKKKLEDEGLFDIEHKVPIPKYPSKVGVVTSSTGAALRDIINIISRRCPGVSILVAPVLVQGSDAAGDISKAIDFLNTRSDIDVIIVGRGGGSIEELWAFNEEEVARSIYRSSIPVISAVGHETDFTIADFVSDLRAPTPSAAAELCVPEKQELRYKINYCVNALYSSLNASLDSKKSTLKHLERSLSSFSPAIDISGKKQYIDSINYKLISVLRHKMDLYREVTAKYSSNLSSLSPLSVIDRGYSITSMGKEKKVIDDVDKVKVGDNINVTVKNGSITCSVREIRKGEVLIGEES
jgi:exodeoxyribonuclease VII, large subunit